MKSINLIWLFALVLTISTSCKNSDSDNTGDRTEKVRKSSKDKKDRGQREKKGITEKQTTEQILERMSHVFNLSDGQLTQVNTILQDGNFEELSMEEQKVHVGELRKQIIADIITPEQMKALKEGRKKSRREGERKSPRKNISIFDRIDNMAEFSDDQQIQIKALVEESGIQDLSGEEQKNAFQELKQRVLAEVLTEKQRVELTTKRKQQKD